MGRLGLFFFFPLDFPSFISEWGLGGVFSIRSNVSSRRLLVSRSLYWSVSMASILRPRFTYPAPPACIYCGVRKGTGDEHIIPRNLGGALVFKDASCKCCERTINKEIETPSSNRMGTFRRQTMPARNRDKKRRPDTYLLRTIDESGNRSGDYLIPANEAPRILYLIRFPPLGLLFPEHKSEQPEMWTWARRADLQRMKEQFGASGHEAGPYDEICFARQLAKIAHSYVFAEHRAIETYEQLLPQFILTGVGDYRELIGCSNDPLDQDKRRWLCNIHWGRFTHGDYAYLCSRFRIFAFTNAPVYEVIVARKHLSLGPLEPVNGRPIER